MHAVPEAEWGTRLNPCFGDVPDMLKTFWRCETLVVKSSSNWFVMQRCLTTFNNDLVNFQTADAPIHPENGGKRVEDNGAIVMTRDPISLREAFIACSGPATLVGFLLSVQDTLDQAISGPSPIPASAVNLCMGILLSLCESLSVAQDLSACKPLPILLFKLMRFDRTFEKAARLAEELLSVGRSIFPLSKVDDLNGLIGGFKDSELALACRVFALVVYDGDEVAISTQNMNKAKKGQHDETETPSSLVIKSNHELLFAVPSFLKRLVGLLKVDGNEALLKDLMRSHEFKQMFRSALSIYAEDGQ